MMTANWNSSTANYGFKLPSKNLSSKPTPEQTIKYDPINKSISIKTENGEWISLSMINTANIVERSISGIKIPEGESSSSIGFRNETHGFASVAEGKMAKTYLRTQEAFASGGFIRPGDSQTTRFIIKADSEPEKLSELMIDDVERFKLPSPKTSVLLDVKLFIKTLTPIPKHYVHKYTILLWMEGKIMKKEVLRDLTLPEDWRFEVNTGTDSESTVSILVSTPVKTRWVGVCKTIEIAN